MSSSDGAVASVSALMFVCASSLPAGVVLLSTAATSAVGLGAGGEAEDVGATSGTLSVSGFAVVASSTGSGGVTLLASPVGCGKWNIVGSQREHAFSRRGAADFYSEIAIGGGAANRYWCHMQPPNPPKQYVVTLHGTPRVPCVCSIPRTMHNAHGEDTLSETRVAMRVLLQDTPCCKTSYIKTIYLFSCVDLLDL